MINGKINRNKLLVMTLLITFLVLNTVACTAPELSNTVVGNSGISAQDIIKSIDTMSVINITYKDAGNKQQNGFLISESSASLVDEFYTRENRQKLDYWSDRLSEGESRYKWKRFNYYYDQRIKYSGILLSIADEGLLIDWSKVDILKGEPLSIEIELQDELANVISLQKKYDDTKANMLSQLDSLAVIKVKYQSYSEQQEGFLLINKDSSVLLDKFYVENEGNCKRISINEVQLTD